MTTSTKAVSSKDVVNADLKGQFEAVVNLEAELKAFDKAVSMLNSGAISVRGLKETIKAANEKGALPTIAVSTAQYFLNTAKVRSLKGAENKSLKETLNVTIQAKRGWKDDFDTALDNAKSYAEFKKAIPETAPSTRSSSKEAPSTADEVLKSALEAWKELDTHDIEDMDTATKFAELLAKAITYNKRKNHPSNQAA
jgi:hypothetical protein